MKENLLNLHKHEECLRQESENLIQNDIDMRNHMNMIEIAMDTIHFFIHQSADTENEDTLTIQLLGIRMFNSSGSALNLMLSGYYQSSAMIMRDLLETSFLLDYFSRNKEMINTWKTSNDKERIREFHPNKIRNFLDGEDGFEKKEREKHYKLLCNLASHPTPHGFAMLTPSKGGNAVCGPYCEKNKLNACIEEVVKILTLATSHFMTFFPTENEKEISVKELFLFEGEKCRKTDNSINRIQPLGGFG